MRFVPRCSARFVARDQDVERLSALIRERAPLVTVTGPAGVGKSTLVSHALVVVRGEVERVLHCSASRSESALDLIEAISSELTGASALEEDRLLDALDARPTLLVLDGFERLVPAAVPEVEKWLSQCSELQVLVTSQRRLGLADERLIDLPPLAVTSSATALFLRCLGDLDPRLAERAAADPMTPALMQALGGLPFAIELAAAKCRTFTPTELYDRHAELLDLSSGSGPSVRTCLDLSWQTLGEAERRTLAQLSLFEGRFSIADAASIVEPNGSSVAAAVETLREGSLIQVEEDGSLRLLLLVRQFAGEALRSMGAPAAQRRHLVWAAAFAEKNVERLHRGDASAALVEVERANADLSAAMTFGAAQADLTARSHALSIAAVLSVSAHLAGSRSDPHEQEDALTDDPELDPVRRAKAKIRRGFVAVRNERLDDAIRDLVSARALLRDEDDPMEQVMAAVLAAEISLAERKEAEAVATLEAIAEKARALGDARAEARAREAAIDALRQLGRPERARQEGERALALLGPDDHLLHAPVLTGLAFAALEAGLLDQALAYVRRGVAILERAPVRRSRTLGGLELAQSRALHLGGDISAAIEGYEQARSTALSGGDPELAGYAELSLGLALVEQQRLVEACEWFGRATARLDPRRPYAMVGAMITAAVEARLGLLESARARAATSIDPLSRATGPFAALARGCAEVLHPGDADQRIAELESPLGGLSIEARVIAGLIRSTATARPAPAGELEIAEDGAWFKCPGGRLVTCGRRPVMRRVVVALARLHGDAPGASLSSKQMVAAGWPGERMLESSARRRLQVMVSRIREIGLRDVLETTHLGYRFDPAWSVRLRSTSS